MSGRHRSIIPQPLLLTMKKPTAADIVPNNNIVTKKRNVFHRVLRPSCARQDNQYQVTVSRRPRHVNDRWAADTVERTVVTWGGRTAAWS